MIASGVIPNDVYAKNGRKGTSIPRVVFVSSESHRSSSGIDIEKLEVFRDYGVKDGVARYGDSKLALTTFATELARRLTTKEGPSVAVHALCPGPVASAIAREAPPYLAPVIGPVIKNLFRSPEDAAEPVIYLSAAPPPDPSEIGLNESKQYERGVELYGGKANALAIEAMDWLRSLTHGRRLAITVACVTVVVAAGFWLFADAPRDSA